MPSSDPSVKIEPLKPPTQPVRLHRRRSAHPAVHGRQHAPADPQGRAPARPSTSPRLASALSVSDRLAPTNRLSPVGSRRAARPAPRRCCGRVHELVPANRRSRRATRRPPVVLKNTRSPALHAAAIDRRCRPGTVRRPCAGPRTPCCAEDVPDQAAAVEPARDRCRRCGTARRGTTRAVPAIAYPSCAPTSAVADGASGRRRVRSRRGRVGEGPGDRAGRGAGGRWQGRATVRTRRRMGFARIIGRSGTSSPQKRPNALQTILLCRSTP